MLPLSRGSDDHRKKSCREPLNVGTRAHNAQVGVRRGHEIFSKTFEKPLDILARICYN